MTALEALKLAQKTGFDQHLQAVVVAGDDPEYAYRFACDVPGAEFDALQEVILRSTDLRTVYDFAVPKAQQGGDITAAGSEPRRRRWRPDDPVRRRRRRVRHGASRGGAARTVRSQVFAVVRS